LLAIGQFKQRNGTEMPTGTVKWFNPTKGYGFIQPSGVFVHISAVERAGLRSLNEGQTIEYEIESNRGIRLLGDQGGGKRRCCTLIRRRVAQALCASGTAEVGVSDTTPSGLLSGTARSRKRPRLSTGK
jgi:CspA family cold shock protein